MSQTLKESEMYFKGRAAGYREAMEDVLKKLHTCQTQAGLRRALTKLAEPVVYRRES